MKRASGINLFYCVAKTSIPIGILSSVWFAAWGLECHTVSKIVLKTIAHSQRGRCPPCAVYFSRTRNWKPAPAGESARGRRQAEAHPTLGPTPWYCKPRLSPHLDLRTADALRLLRRRRAPPRAPFHRVDAPAVTDLAMNIGVHACAVDGRVSRVRMRMARTPTCGGAGSGALPPASRARAPTAGPASRASLAPAPPRRRSGQACVAASAGRGLRCDGGASLTPGTADKRTA